MVESLISHHAYILAGGKSEALNYLHKLWEKSGVNLTGSPDFFLWQEELFGIEEARKLTEYSARKAFTGQKVFFIAPEKITVEAQNALLKTFEEPIACTHFFLCVREENLLLPTLRSRMKTIKVGGSQEKGEAEKFLAMTPKERLSFVKKFVDDERNLSIFLDSLLLVLRDREGKEGMKKAFEVRSYSDDRSVSARLVLEHLALSL